MTNEVELEEEFEIEYIPESMSFGVGMVVIFDMEAFYEKTGALGIQVTQEDGIYLINKDGQLEAMPMYDGRVKPKLSPIK